MTRRKTPITGNRTTRTQPLPLVDEDGEGWVFTDEGSEDRVSTFEAPSHTQPLPLVDEGGEGWVFTDEGSEDRVSTFEAPSRDCLSVSVAGLVRDCVTT
jgi:hypothetical protein